MPVHPDNLEEQLVSIASSIKTDPYSWKDWLSLQLKIKGNTEDDNAKITQEIDAYLYDCLKDKENCTYFNHENVFYIFSKNIPREFVLQIGVQLKNLVCRKRYGLLHYHLYEFPDNSYELAEEIFNKRAEKFSIDVSFSDMVMTEATETRLQNEKTKKLLLVEDDPTIHCLVSNALEDEYEIIHVSKAHDLFSLYEACNPNIVFLDIGLPNANGKELLDWIMYNDPAACVVMLSGQGNSANISECIENGAKGFISKPFTKSDMFYYLEKYA